MRLITGWQNWWRLRSIQLAAIAGMIATAIVASPQLLLGLIAFVPENLRWLAAIVTGFVVFVVPALTRLKVQPKLAEKCDDDK